MATEKQKKIAQLIVENTKLDKPLNGGEMLEKVGYSKSMQTAKVNDVLGSEGVKEELENMGFTEENAKKVVAEIMNDPTKDPSSRLRATDQVFKVRGSYAPEKKELSGSIDTKVPAEDLDKLAEAMANKLKEQKI